jgi:glycosyltransferase involved in cell wall biosynthesis
VKLLVSLIIPVFNESQTISGLINTIIEQTFQPDETILVDGGSTDNTVQLAKEFILNRPSFRIIKAGMAMPGQGRNIGAKEAKNEWIAFTDAGIRLDRHWLKNLVDKVKENPGVDIIYGNYSPQLNSFFDKCATITYVSPLKKGSIRSKFIASSLIRKKVWEQVGGFHDWRATEDLVFMEKAEKSGFRVAIAPDAMVFWQLRSTILSTYKRFDVYSKYNVWAGRQAEWQYPVVRQYMMLLVIIALGIFHSKYWFFLLPLWIIARVGRRIYMHRQEFGIKELFNPLTFLGVIGVTLTMDAGTFSGWIKAILSKPSRQI